jgi:hypothetical protein
MIASYPEEDTRAAVNMFFSEFSLQDFWLLLVAAVLIVILVG